MSKLKQLASDTVIYGASSILGRIIYVMLTPLYTTESILSKQDNGVMAGLFTLSAFLTVLFGFGLETAFFRFALKEKNNLSQSTSTALKFVLVSTILLFSIGMLCIQPLSVAIGRGEEIHLVKLVLLIVALDTLSSIPFAYLRATSRPVRFAIIKLGGICINVAANLFFFLLCPYVIAKGESHALYPIVKSIYNPEFGVGYVFVSNILDALFKLLCLSSIFSIIRHAFDMALAKKMLRYGTPIMLVLFGSIINEVADRFFLTWYLPHGKQTNDELLGIYNNCYKLAIFLSLFTQSFRYAGEPFFFSRANDIDAKETYAIVLKYFTIFTLFGFLAISINLNWIKHILITSESYFVGLTIVPVLLLAYVFSGIYYNLSIWYKLTDRTNYGAIVAMIGAMVTISLNILFIPRFGYMASAWATLACFFTMSVIAYFWGQKKYPVPYEIRKISLYILVTIIIYLFSSSMIENLPEQSMIRYLIQGLVLILYAIGVYFMEWNELKTLLINPNKKK